MSSSGNPLSPQSPSDFDAGPISVPGVAPQSVKEPFWNYVDLLLFLGIGFSIFVLSSLPFAVAFHFYSSSKFSILLLLAIQLTLYLSSYLGFKIVLGIRYHRPVLYSLGWRPSRVNLLWVGLTGVLLAFAVSGIASLLHTPEVDSPLEQFAGSAPALIAIAILAVVVGPFFEELMFRGFLQPLLSRTFGTIAGVGGTGLLFGLLHLPEYKSVWQYAFAIWIVGVVLGLVRVYTGSIIPSTVMHACFNAVSVVALVVTKVGKHHA